jgi:thiol-disulfide isomerase/thioredoxin
LRGAACALTTLRNNSHTSRFFSLRRQGIAGVLLLLFSFRLLGAGQQVFDLAGSAVDPLKQAPGKVVVLVFVRTDCPISNRYAPLIQELSTRYASGTVFFLVFPDKNESAKQIRAYLQEYGYKSAALRDSEHALVKKSLAKVTPEVAVFDAKRELIYHGRIDNLYQDFGKARRTATTHELADAIEAASKGVAPPANAVDGIGCFISDLK